MYICNNCKHEFSAPIKQIERHGLACPPYEIFYVCPACKSGNYQKLHSGYCLGCGAKLQNPDNDYCSEECKISSKKQRALELRRKKALCKSELYQRVQEIEAYNKVHGTRYSYGQYNSIIANRKKEGKK